MRGLDGIPDWTDVGLSKPRESVMDREAWGCCSALSDRTDPDASRAPWSASQSPVQTRTLLETPAAYGSHSQPGTWHAVAKPPREVAGMRDMGRQACPWPLAPTPRGSSPSLTLGCGHRPCRCWPPLVVGDHRSPRPYPRAYPHPPYPTPPPHPHPQQENQHKPRSITAATRASSRSPSGGREAGHGRPQAGRGESGAARGRHCGQKSFAPGDGGGGLNRAWAGGAGSRGGASGAVLSC